MKDNTKIITGVCRFSYLFALYPHESESGESRYSVSLVIPKTDTKTIEKINAAVRAAYEKGAAKLAGKGNVVPKLETLKTPLRDGDAEKPSDPVYSGAYFMNASNQYAPGIVDKYNHEIDEDTAEDEIYSGIYGRASVQFYAFNKKGNRGIACSLLNLMKTSDGERLSGTAKATEDFAEFAEEETQIDTNSGEVLEGNPPF